MILTINSSLRQDQVDRIKKFQAENQIKTFHEALPQYLDYLELRVVSLEARQKQIDVTKIKPEMMRAPGTKKRTLTGHGRNA